MSSRRSSFRRRQKRPIERFKDSFRNFIAFMFSNVGIILLVIFYTIGGAFVFQAIEIFEHERLKVKKPHHFVALQRNFTAECLDRIWELTAENISFYNRVAYKRKIDGILLEFQRGVVKKELLGDDIAKQWSFSGAFLYSLTVITTIGYGNISPKSDWGKLVTILYAIIGMPLFLLYLSNIGDLMAKSFKWIYSKVCLCRICPGVARRRIIRERRKSRQLAKNHALHNMESSISGSGSGSGSGSSSGSVSGSSSQNSKGFQSSSNSSSSSSDSHTSSRSTRTETSTPPPTSEMASTVDESDEDEEIEREIRASTEEITVPLTVCIIIMISYILSGAILFGLWEDWNYLDGSYFCFISLSSIGFGDLVPGDRVITADKDKVELSFILCAVYLLMGMALIAMCFNLMQEQVIHNLRTMKRAFKACFRCRR